MILSARVYSIQPMSREFRERIRARKQKLLELRSRRRMAKLVAAAERRKEQEPMEPDLTVPESQRLTAAEAQREAAQMLALLRRERLLEDLTDAEEAAIYETAKGRVLGSVPVGDWLAMVHDLKARRAIQYPAPKAPRRDFGSGGW